MSNATFETLSSRHRLDATLRTETAMRVGAEKSVDVVGTDLPVVRDGMGRPYIPGSALKGGAKPRIGLKNATRSEMSCGSRVD